MINRLCLVTLLTLNSVGCAAAPQTQTAAAPLPPDTHAPRIEVRPTNYSMTSHVSFDEKGNTKSSHVRSMLSVHITLPKDLHVTGYKDLHLTRIVTDTGAELTPPESEESPRFTNSGLLNGQFDGGLNMPAPPAGTQAFRQIAGTVTFQCLVGPIRKAVLPPLKDIADHRVHIQGLDRDIWVIVHPAQSSLVRIEMSAHARQLLTRTRFTDAEGNPIKGDLSNFGYNYISTYYRVELPPTGHVVLEFYSKLDEILIPFTIASFALPQPPLPKSSDVTINTAPVEPAKTPGTAKPAATPAPNNLRTVIE